MHFGHPKTTTAIKNQIFVKIWVFQGLPYTRLGPDLVILSPFWGKKFQNPCKKCPSHGEKFLKIFLFFKNVPNSPRKNFGRLKTIRNLQKPIYIKNIWKPMQKEGSVRFRGGQFSDGPQMYVTMQNSDIFSIWGVPILRSTTYIHVNQKPA